MYRHRHPETNCMSPMRVCAVIVLLAILAVLAVLAAPVPSTPEGAPAPSMARYSSQDVPSDATATPSSSFGQVAGGNRPLRANE